MSNSQQIIKDDQGNKIGVFLPIKEYERILDQLEELEDIKAYDEYKSLEEESIPLRDAIKQRKQQNG
ncbi:MAG: hypothetical protein V5A59_09820 [Bacteroidales bacterium]|nr:hypothetical protein [Bacteroidales bacterium]